MQPNPNEPRLVPYVEIDGARTLPDSFLEDIFDRMVAEGLLSMVFAGVGVRTSEDFVQLMRHPSNLPVFILSGSTCIGFAWLNGIGATFAYGHFCTFENDVATPDQMGAMVLEYWWESFSAIEVLLGTIPSFNGRAIAFVERLGFQRVGEIPRLYIKPATKEHWSAVVLYLLRP